AAEFARFDGESIGNAGQHFADLRFQVTDLAVNPFGSNCRRHFEGFFGFFLFYSPFGRQFGGAPFLELTGQALISLQHLLLSVLVRKSFYQRWFFRHKWHVNVWLAMCFEIVATAKFLGKKNPKWSLHFGYSENHAF